MINEIKKDYESGMSINHIAAKYKIWNRKVMEIVKDVKRKPGRITSKPTMDELEYLKDALHLANYKGKTRIKGEKLAMIWIKIVNSTQ